MFNIGWTELVVIAIVALIVIGPKELPGALRTLGQWMSKIRRMASEFQNQFQDAMREAELADLKKEVDEMTAKAQSYAHFDPIDDIRKDIENAAGPPPVLDAPVTETPPTSPPTGETSLPDASPPPSATAAEPVQVAETPPTPPPAPAETVNAVPDAAKPDAWRAA